MAGSGTPNTETSNSDSGTGKGTTGVSGQPHKRLPFARARPTLQYGKGKQCCGRLTPVGTLLQVEEQQPTTIKGLRRAEPLKQQPGSASPCISRSLHTTCAMCGVVFRSMQQL